MTSFAPLSRLSRALRASVLVSLLALPLASGTASAADPSMGQDEVTLKNGGTIRGTVVTSEPGVGVKIIELGQTETRMVPWSQVGDVQRGKFAPQAAPPPPAPPAPGYSSPPPPPPPPYPAPPPPATQAVRLHIESPEPATVLSHRKAYGQIGWRGFVVDAATPVCMSPCDQPLEAGTGLTYSVSGDFNGSKEFLLAGGQGDMELSVIPGSRGLRRGGIALTALGGAAILAGGLILLVGNAEQSSGTGPVDDGLVPAGAGVLGGGIAMLLGGIIAITQSKTTIDLHPLGARPAPASGGMAVAPRYWLGEF
jgi:hypothetical protein